MHLRRVGPLLGIDLRLRYKELGVEVTQRDWIGATNHVLNHGVVLGIKARDDERDEIIIIKGFAGCQHLDGETSDLGEVGCGGHITLLHRRQLVTKVDDAHLRLQPKQVANFRACISRLGVACRLSHDFTREGGEKECKDLLIMCHPRMIHRVVFLDLFIALLGRHLGNQTWCGAVEVAIEVS